jgi:hypothetical protein
MRVRSPNRTNATITDKEVIGRARFAAGSTLTVLPTSLSQQSAQKDPAGYIFRQGQYPLVLESMLMPPNLDRNQTGGG